MISVEMYLCRRCLGDGKFSYVSHVPGEDGADWGYVDDREKAKPLTLYWVRRFKRDVEFVKGGKVLVDKVVLEERKRRGGETCR